MSEGGGRRVSTTFSDYLDGGAADGVPLWRGPRPAGHRTGGERRSDDERHAGDGPARGGRAPEAERADPRADREAGAAGRSNDVPPPEGGE